MVREIETGKAVYKCALEQHRNKWKNEIYLEKELFPLKKTQFGAMQISIPNEYKRYFTSNFGKNWYNQGKISYNHKNEKNISPNIIWTLKESDYEPAKPFYIEKSFDSSINRWWQF